MTITYSLRNFGKDFIPVNLNNGGDVVGFKRKASGELIPQVYFGDAPFTLSDDIFYWRLTDITDDGLILGSPEDGKWLFFDSVTESITEISISGFQYISDVAIDDFGNLSGTVDTNDNGVAERGFIMNRDGRFLRWVFPTNVPLPPGAFPYLRLHDRNIHGHATGVQGWERGSLLARGSYDWQEVPIFYDGVSVTPIGSYASFAIGTKITNNDRILARYYSEPGPDYDVLYDGKTNTITPFYGGNITDINSAGQMIWDDQYPHPNATFITDAQGTRSLDQLLPASSGFSHMEGMSMNDAGAILGTAKRGSDEHGILLTPEYQATSDETDSVIARILWGIINDAGGIELVGGHLHHVPPRGPLHALLEALPAQLRSELAAAIDHARLDSPLSARMFSSQVRRLVENYRRQK